MSEDMMQIESVQKVRGEGIGVRLPLVGRVVPAGDPCDGDDWVDEWVDLNEFMVGNPEGTFLMRVRGDSMLMAGIRDRDYLVVDREREALDQDVVVAEVEGELTVKRLRWMDGQFCLVGENPDYARVITGEIRVWGVVCGVLRKYCR